MKLIGYLRVSSEGQLDGYGLDAQEHALRNWGVVHRVSLIHIVTDIGVSGATDALDRPGFIEVMHTISSGGVDGLLVARLDRLARALTVQEAALALLWRAGAEVFTTEGGRVLRDDPDDPMRTALRQVVGVFSELERRMVVKRLRDGRTEKAKAGRKSVGAYAFGFGPTGQGRERDAGPRPDEVDTVTTILQLHDEGISYRAIAARLDGAGLRPRRAERWSAMTVRSVVQRSIAAGGS